MEILWLILIAAAIVVVVRLMARNGPQRGVLQPAPGIFPDEESFNLPGRWEDCQNVRFVNGLPQVIGGWSLQSSTALTGIPNAVLEWASASGGVYHAIGTVSGLGTSVKLYGGTGYSSGFVDITPGVLTGVSNWSLDAWGERLLACPAGNPIYEWDLNTANDAVVLTNAPAECGGMLVTKTRQVMAFDCNEEAAPNTRNGRCIRWSDVENNNDWATTPSNLAGEFILDGNGGTITAWRKVGPYVAVWSVDELFLGRFTGDPGAPWLFDLIATGCGILGQKAIAEANGVLFWITRDYRVLRWVPGGIPEPIYCPITNFLQGDLNTSKSIAGRLWGFYNQKHNEVWFGYPSNAYVGGDLLDYPNRFVAMNVETGLWFRGVLKRTIMYQGPFNLIGCYADASFNVRIYNHETGKRGDGTSSLAWSIRTGFVYFDNAERRIEIQGLIPSFKDQEGNITCTITAADYPQAAETQVASFTLSDGEDREDFFASGMMFRIVLSGGDSGGSADTYMRLGKLTFPYVLTGER